MILAVIGVFGFICITSLGVICASKAVASYQLMSTVAPMSCCDSNNAVMTAATVSERDFCIIVIQCLGEGYFGFRLNVRGDWPCCRVNRFTSFHFCDFGLYGLPPCLAPRVVP